MYPQGLRHFALPSLPCVVFVQGFHKLHGQSTSEFSSNPQPKLPSPPQILGVGKHPQHLGNAQVVPAHSMPCLLVFSSDRTWVVRGDVLLTGVAGWRFVSPLPLIPQVISLPHLLSLHPRGVQPHPSPHCGTSSSHTPGSGYGKMIKP